MYGGNWCPALHTNDKHTQPPYSKSFLKFKEVYYAQFSGFMPYQVNPKAEKKSTFNAIHIISWIHICIVISLATLKGRMHCSNLFWKLKMFRRWQSPGWTIPSSPPTSRSTATRYSTWGTVCSLKIMFFLISLQPIPWPTHSRKRSQCTVTPIGRPFSERPAQYWRGRVLKILGR